IVAIFVLLIACINFMNLATAQAVKRAKEVGLRKAIGAGRSSLIVQFISEAMLLTLLSLLLAFTLSSLLLPAFNQLTGKQLSFPLGEPVFWITAAGLLIVTGFVAGSYPALFLSSLHPVKVLKGTLKFGTGASFFRQGLVVFQFSLAIVLIIAMIVAHRQISYIQSKNLGYDRDNLVYIPIEGELITKYSLFKDEAAKLPGIESISKMRNSPTGIEHHTGSIDWPGKDKNQGVSFADGVVGYDFVKTMKLELKEGRDFAKGYGTDSASYLLNETAAKKIGFENAVGQTVLWGNRPGKVLGVLKDFHFTSMHEAIEPLIIRLDENWGWGTVLVRIQAGRTKEAIAGLEKISKEINSKIPFTYRFSDLEFAKLYKSDQVVSRLSNYFALLAILISCLGLFGLATFSALQRTKEIGIRKVLGASVMGITTMLSKEFVKLVLIAILIGAPVAWWAVSKWLQSFEYRTQFNWWIIVIAGSAAVLIALITISFQAIKSALANPVKSLRSE
ncbi:MAG TPA: FtsX-like permease family protein, partial [Chitinophagaceae bacterium]|nr:FtsX-like permease family protein [Chitinophagaceae bacterium]